MKYSKLFGKTVKSTSADMVTASHRLLYQGGFIRQVAAGRYAFLPLGFRVWNKIMEVVDEEMVKVGSQRILTPNLHPIEIWKSTNRDQAFGDEMYIIEDHHGATFALGATAEGLMVELVKSFNPTYKNLPLYVHQFSNKFRDEKRPKGGLMRVREFMMKDAYSFDVSEKQALESYEKFFQAYLRIAKKLNLDVVPVEADSGAIGGDYNHEFLVRSDKGEGEALECDSCSYAAHIERAQGKYKQTDQDTEMKQVEEYVDELAVTCEVLAKNMGITIEETTKTILFKSGEQFIAAMVRGDYDVNEAKLKRYLGLDTLKLATHKEVNDLTGAQVGFAGPIGLPDSVRVIADTTCEGRINFEVGANKTGVHLYNINYERDMPNPEFADIRLIKEGDGCPRCDTGSLVKFSGIEWGHCFKQDLFYTTPHKGMYINADGKEQEMWMGAYGIGLGRSMATIVETHHDEQGIIWPDRVAPYTVHLISLPGGEAMADQLYQKLWSTNVEVLWDDREDVRAGQKFADADLIGCPVRLVVSAKTGDKVEWKRRSEKNSELIEIEEMIKRLQ
jgi:prolyl-tRNA synthetase